MDVGILVRMVCDLYDGIMTKYRTRMSRESNEPSIVATRSQVGTDPKGANVIPKVTKVWCEVLIQAQ